MLAIARALVANPELLLVDEQISGLAPRIAETIFTKLNELRDEGLTIFLVDQFVEKHHLCVIKLVSWRTAQ
jgi:branched-chain amino acid transport system ATP-binding protein